MHKQHINAHYSSLCSLKHQDGTVVGSVREKLCTFDYKPILNVVAVFYISKWPTPQNTDFLIIGQLNCANFSRRMKFRTLIVLDLLNLNQLRAEAASECGSRI